MTAEPRTNESRVIRAPRPAINPSKIGKEVAIAPPSSSVIGAFEASPSTRKDMAMRW